jgi:hypothetical protein
MASAEQTHNSTHVDMRTGVCCVNNIVAHSHSSTVVVRCYDGKRLISAQVAKIMRVPLELPDWPCESFDIIHSFFCPLLDRLSMTSEAARLASQLMPQWPDDVITIVPARNGAAVGRHIDSLRRNPISETRCCMTIVGGYVVSISKKDPNAI